MRSFAFLTLIAAAAAQNATSSGAFFPSMSPICGGALSTVANGQCDVVGGTTIIKEPGRTIEAHAGTTTTLSGGQTAVNGKTQASGNLAPLVTAAPVFGGLVGVGLAALGGLI